MTYPFQFRYVHPLILRLGTLHSFFTLSKVFFNRLVCFLKCSGQALPLVANSFCLNPYCSFRCGPWGSRMSDRETAERFRRNAQQAFFLRTFRLSSLRISKHFSRRRLSDCLYIRGWRMRSAALHSMLELRTISSGTHSSRRSTRMCGLRRKSTGRSGRVS